MLKKLKEDGRLGLQIVRERVRNLFYRSLEEMDSIKIRLEIRKLEKERDELLLQSGKIIYERFQTGENQQVDSELTSLFSKAVQIQDEAEILKSDLADRLKPGVKEPVK